MPTTTRPFVQLALLFTFALVAVARADEVDGYDSIIRELTSNSVETSYSPSVRSSDDLVKFHFGVGVISSQLSLDLPARAAKNVALSGFEARFGIDLLSRHWEALGTVRSFNPEQTNLAKVSLREFDLMVAYKNSISKNRFEMMIGGGMSARYLDLSGALPPGARSSYTTPSTVLQTGLGVYLTPSLSTNLFLSYRDPLISETADDGGFDGTLNVTGHF